MTNPVKTYERVIIELAIWRACAAIKGVYGSWTPCEHNITQLLVSFTHLVNRLNAQGKCSRNWREILARAAEQVEAERPENY